MIDKKCNNFRFFFFKLYLIIVSLNLNVWYYLFHMTKILQFSCLSWELEPELHYVGRSPELVECLLEIHCSSPSYTVIWNNTKLKKEYITDCIFIDNLTAMYWYIIMAMTPILFEQACHLMSNKQFYQLQCSLVLSPLAITSNSLIATIFWSPVLYTL